MATITNAGNHSASKDTEQLNLHTLLVGLENGTATVENSLAACQKLNIELSYDPAILLLGIYPRDLKTYVHKRLILECLY